MNLMNYYTILIYNMVLVSYIEQNIENNPLNQ